MHQIKLFTYTSLLLIVGSGIVCRRAWLAENSVEIEDGQERLPIEVKFTQVEVISKFVLFLPVVVMIPAFFYIVLKSDRELARLFIRDVMLRWVIALWLWTITFEWKLRSKASFLDPSDHVSAIVMTQSAHATTYAFVSRGLK